MTRLLQRIFLIILICWGCVICIHVLCYNPKSRRHPDLSFGIYLPKRKECLSKPPSFDVNFNKLFSLSKDEENKEIDYNSIRKVYDVGDRISLYPFVDGDTLRTISDIVITEDTEVLDYDSISDGDIIFLPAQYQLGFLFFNEWLPKINAKIILMIHNGDSSFLCANYEKLNNKNLVAIFAQNSDVRYHEKIFHLPIGLENFKYHQRQHIENSERVKLFSSSKRKNDKLLYLNFNDQTNLPERRGARLFFQGKKYVEIDNTFFKVLGDYYDKMSSFKFVLAPWGNGYSSHRLWQALYSKCYVVTKESPLDPQFDELPVIIVNDWKQVTEEFLRKKEKEFEKAKFNYDRLHSDYYFKRILHVKDMIKKSNL